jgi:hypothetical protein
MTLPQRLRHMATPGSDTSRKLRFFSGVCLWILAPLGFGLLALGLGQDANWDLRNYHFYNAFALLHGRLGFDIAPAQTPTYYNPLLHVPFYYLVKALPPRGVGFVLGALQGLNLPLLYLLARQLITVPEPRYAVPLAVLTALLGTLGAANISEIGTTFGDNVVSLLVLSALWLIIVRRHQLAAHWRAAAITALSAGVLVGLAVGLKQPTAVFAVGLGAGLLGLVLPWPRRIMLLLAFGVGGFAGLASTGGYWLYQMWSHYGNPLFPYFNTVFHSAMASASDYRDVRFLPQGWIEWLFFPAVFTVDPARTTEGWFRDLRIPLLYGLALILLVRVVVTRGRARNAGSGMGVLAVADVSAQRYVLIFCVVSYVAWLKLFAIYRYLITIELLAPLAIWLLITHLVADLRKAMATAIACALLMVVTLSPLHWGRVAWGDDYFGVTPPVLPDPDHTMILMTGHEPTAYVIPFFPRQIRFLRIQSYFTGPSPNPNGTDRLMQGLVAAHRGPLYILYRGTEQDMADDALHAYGLTRQPGSCQTLHPHIESQIDDRLYFCPAVRTGRP